MLRKILALCLTLAMQLAAPLAAESPYAAAWMRQWGGQ